MNQRESSGIFQQEFFIPELKSKTKADALEEMVEVLVRAGQVKNKRIILEAIQQRELLGSTGIGKEVAIPHCRTLAVSKLYAVFGRSRKGIAYGSVDKKPVKLLFLVVGPPVEKTNLYLPLLGKLCERLHHAKIRNRLLEAKDYRAFLQIMEGGE
jgi:mannitol/fructose-specific phosphotransferase system IIA component (Ntr-type)